MSDVPSCYMYMFVNTTDIEFEKNFTEYQDLKNQTLNCSGKDTPSFHGDMWLSKITGKCVKINCAKKPYTGQNIIKF